MNLDIADPEHGVLEVIPMRNGNLLVEAPYYGFMENVSIVYPDFSLKLMISASSAGSGKSIIWYDNFSMHHSQAYGSG